jgi:hypothetical protein
MHACMYVCMYVCVYIYIYMCVCVCVCVCVRGCVFAYSSRMNVPICTKLGMFIPWDQEVILEMSKLRRIVLSSSPGEGGSCSSETKHDRRTAPKPKLFASKRRLQKERPQPRKTVLGSSASEDGSVSRKLISIEERRQGQSYLFRWGDYRNRDHNHEKSVLGSSHLRMLL